MERMERIAHYPDFPYRMKADLAAMFVDESVTTFQAKVGKKWPEGRKDGKNVFWYKDELIHSMELDRHSANDDVFELDK